MAQSLERICKFCQTVIPQNRVYGATAICDNCGQADVKRKAANPAFKWTMIAVVIVSIAGLTAFFKNELMASINPAYAVKSMTPVQLASMEHSCMLTANHECLINVYQRMSEMDPQDVSAKANWAFQLTDTKRFAEADPIYKQILASGRGTYDLMAFYAQNLSGLNQNAEAMKWYEKSLGVNPNLMDVTQKLASLYVQDKRPSEAVSILKSFTYKFPDAEGSLAGDISASLELFENLKPNESLRLVGFSQGHFGLPLQMGRNGKLEVFMVDTGATTVLMPTTDIQKYWPELMATSRSAKAETANGQILEIHKVRLPKIKLAGWEFTNIEAAYCDSCTRLAGMSFLKNVKMATESHGELATLTLTR